MPEFTRAAHDGTRAPEADSTAGRHVHEAEMKQREQDGPPPGP